MVEDCLTFCYKFYCRNLFVWGQSASSGKADDKRSLSQLGSNKFALLAPTTGSSSLKGSSMEKDRINSYKSLEGMLCFHILSLTCIKVAELQ